MSFGNIVNLIAIASLLSAVLFSSIWGGRAERIGAAIVGGGMLLTWTAQALGGSAPLIAFLSIDFLMAAGLGVLTFRYPDKLWPGLAGCAQLLIVVFSATRAIDFPLSETAYLYALNLCGVGVAAALAGGTWASRWYKPPVSDWEAAGAP